MGQAAREITQTAQATDKTPGASAPQTSLNGAEILSSPAAAKILAQNDQRTPTANVQAMLGNLTIDGSDLAPKASAQSGALHQGELLGEGLVTGLVLNPINGITQLANHTFSTDIKPVKFENQTEVNNSTAGKIGEVAGTMADFTALSLASGGIAGAVGLSGMAATAAGLGASGALEGGVLMPTQKQDSHFFEDRGISSLVGATSGALGGMGGEIVSGAATHISNALLARASVTVGSMLLGSGLGAGTSEASTLATTGKPASDSNLLHAAEIGAVGGAVGGAAGIIQARPTDVTVSGGKPDTIAAHLANAKDTTGDGGDGGDGTKDVHQTSGASQVNDASQVNEANRVNGVSDKAATADDRGIGTVMKAAQVLDNSGRPVSEGNAERVATAHPPLSSTEMQAQRIALQNDLTNYKGGADGKSVAGLLDSSNMTAAQKETVLNVLAETRASFLKPGTDGKVPAQQQDNYWHTLGELKEGLESSQTNGLTANETQQALLSGILSDSHKYGWSSASGGNFFTHHLDGALAADTILPRNGVPPEETAAVRQAILEHQISPPNFMSQAYASEIRAGMARAGVTPTAADEANIANIQKLMANPMTSPTETDASGASRLVFTPAERNLLSTYVGKGTENWYIPSSKPGMVGIAADVFDNYLPEASTTGAPLKGPFKIAGLRGPNENPPDLTLNGAIAGVKGNMQQSLGLLTDADQARAAARISNADTVYDQAKEQTAAWLQNSLGITPGADTPYWSKPLTPPPKGANAAQMQEWRSSPDVKLGVQIQAYFAKQLLDMRFGDQTLANAS